MFLFPAEYASGVFYTQQQRNPSGGRAPPLSSNDKDQSGVLLKIVVHADFHVLLIESSPQSTALASLKIPGSGLPKRRTRSVFAE